MEVWPKAVERVNYQDCVGGEWSGGVSVMEERWDTRVKHVRSYKVTINTVQGDTQYCWLQSQFTFWRQIFSLGLSTFYW